MLNQERLEYLFQRYLDRAETPAELEELMELIDNKENQEVVHQLLDTAKRQFAGSAHLDEEQTERIFTSIVSYTHLSGAKVIPIGSSSGQRLWRIAVAVVVLVLAGVGSYRLLFNKPLRQQEVVQQSVPADVPAPATNRATITLADGQRIYLDSAADGMLAVVGNVRLEKLADGSVAYQGTSSAPVYNTLSNPRGSKVIEMTLADGSRVWLNAGSSVTYPVAFSGSERRVSVQGEAYFEVRRNVAMPFKVAKGDIEITVLGTHFNVNAYDDQGAVQVTLLEGSVEVRKGSSKGLLKPGQQAQVREQVKVVHVADLEAVMAWKNGYFKFNDLDIQSIIRQLNQWYDADIKYEGNKPGFQVTGYLKRDVPISKVLDMLAYTAGVQYTITDKKVILK